MTNIRKYIRCCTISAIAAICLTGCSDAGESSYKQGMEQFRAGDYDAAVMSFEGAIEANSEKAEYYIGYGMTLIAKGEYESAREQFGKVVLDTDSRIVRENNKRAYRGIALTYYYEGNYEQAKGYLELALKTKELDDMDMDLTAYMANCELYLNNYDNSLEYWNKLIDGGGNDELMSEYYLGRAKSQSILANYSDAISDYRNAINTEPDNYDAYVGLYSVLMETLDENGAVSVLDEALGNIGDDEDDIFYASMFRYYKGEYDEAEEGFGKALEQGNAEAVYYLGRICQDKGDYEGAIAKYSEYLIKKPSGKNAEYCNQLGGCLVELERYDEAADWFGQGVALAAGSIRNRLVYNQIVAYERMGDYKSARDMAGEYLKDNTDEKLQREYEFIKTRYRV